MHYALVMHTLWQVASCQVIQVTVKYNSPSRTLFGSLGHQALSRILALTHDQLLDGGAEVSDAQAGPRIRSPYPARPISRHTLGLHVQT
jgi:hypothetical protein